MCQSTLCVLEIIGNVDISHILSDQGEEDDEEDQPLSLSWPESKRKRFTYLLILPIVFPLWITLPDVRKAVSFCMTRCRCELGNTCNPETILVRFSLEFQEVFSHYVPGIDLLDRRILLPDGVVGSSGKTRQDNIRAFISLFRTSGLGYPFVGDYYLFIF